VLTNYFPELWPFFLGGLFIAVVLLFPDGLVGLFTRVREKWTASGLWVRKSPASSESNG
jgi:urea transport system permease protein